MSIIVKVQEQKVEQMTEMERWDMAVRRAKGSGTRFVGLQGPEEVREEMARAREEKEKVDEERRKREEYEREWPLPGERR